MAPKRGAGREADEVLVDRVHRRDTLAFAALYDRYSTAAYSTAYRIVGDRQLAEDVTQEAFLSLWRTSARFDAARGNVSSWLLTSVRNRAIDALRRGGSAPALDHDDETLLDEVPDDGRTDSAVLNRETRTEVRTSMRSMPKEQAQAIWLAYFEGLTHHEIARLLALPLGTVKGRLRLGLEKIRRALPEQV